MKGDLKRVLAADRLPPLRKTGELVTTPREAVPAAVEPKNRLTTSVFTIDHRGEYIAEQRHDADVLDQQAAAIIEKAKADAAALIDAAHKEAAPLTHKAISLRISADHMEANPPES